MNTLQELVNVHVKNRNSGYSTTYRGVGYDSTEYTNKVLDEASQPKRTLKYRGVEVVK